MSMIHRYIPQVMLMFFISVSGVYSGQTSLPAPGNITIVSVNLKHTLHWEPVSVVQGNVTYSVQTQGEFEKHYINDYWSEAEQCKSIHTHQCNVTGEVSANVLYNFRVRAELGNQTSDWTELEQPFHRKSSLLFPPKINLQVSGLHLIANIEDYGSSFRYFVSYWQKGKEDEVKSIKTNKHTTSPSIAVVEGGKEYCVQVIAYAISISTNSSSSDKTCIQVPVQNHSAVFIGLLSLFGVLVAFVLVALGVWKFFNVIRYSCCPDEDIPDVLKESRPHKMTRNNHLINKREQISNVDLHESFIPQETTSSCTVKTQML